MAVYKPLFVYLTPASIPQVVAHIQKYLADNPIISDPEAIAEAIQEYIEAHPEIIAVASVNGKTGNVVLTGSDININASSAVSVETQLLNLASMISAAGSNITQIESQLETIYTNIGTLETNVSNNTSAIGSLQTSVEGQGTRLTTAENDIDSLESAQSAQGTRLNSAEGNISSLQTRMTQAETDIETVESGVNTNSEAISNINSSIGIIQSNISDLNTEDSTSWIENGITFAASRKGFMCTLSAVTGSTTNTIQTRGVLCTLPTGFKPSVGMFFNNASALTTCTWYYAVDTGEITLPAGNQAISSGGYPRFSITYVVGG